MPIPKHNWESACSWTLSGREGTDQPARDGRQEVARVGRVRVEIIDNPLPHEPRANAQRCRKEHHDERPPGLEGKLGDRE
jgi:hypothetical protein